MFKTLGSRSSSFTISKGIYGKVYKGQPYLYIDGCLLNQEFRILEENCSLTRAAKLITGYTNINGKSWFKKIEPSELTDEAFNKLTEMGLLNETHQ